MGNQNAFTEKRLIIEQSVFNSQLKIINEHDTNPFAWIPQPDDILAAAPEHQLIDEDEEEDELIVV